MRFSSRVALAALACAGAILRAPPAFANDTTAALTAGGLVFGKTDDIEMRSEDLSISEKEIVVRYRFFNRARADQVVTVAFPMPGVDFTDANNISVPDDEADNFLDFRTSVDGAPVKAEVERKAMIEGRDVTARLRALNIPLMPRAKRTLAALDALPKDVQKKLEAEKIVRADDYDAGKGMEHHVGPEWTLKQTWFWKQTFPAGREIAIEHRYKPSVGATVQTSLLDRDADAATQREYRTRFCADRDFINGVQAMTRRNKGVPPPELRIDYVLTTGANWAGPIGDYRLTVDKGRPDALVSFCETGVKKTGPTTFEVRRRNFTPTRDIDIMIVRTGE
ncbi:MAG TPA: DUF4424 domain-containing protein [Rhodoblastus sp.]|nr:DUF4424 domain-containing protein [Rhodoblastus sp.]